MTRAEGSAGGQREHDLALPVAASAVRLSQSVRYASGGIIYVARGERRAVLLVRILAALTPALEVLPFPAWDSVPYDRAAPSRK